MTLVDAEDTAILGSTVVDDTGTFAIREAGRRVDEAWKLGFEQRLIADACPADLYLDGFRNDSFPTLSLARFL